MQDQATPAFLGGPKAVTLEAEDIFTWPVITAEVALAAGDGAGE